jgi:hypothetical protein
LNRRESESDLVEEWQEKWHAPDTDAGEEVAADRSFLRDAVEVLQHHLVVNSIFKCFVGT